MSLTAVRVDLFDEFDVITLGKDQTQQWGFSHAGFDANHWVMCSISPIHSGRQVTSVEIVRQWQNMEADGTTNHQVYFHNIGPETAVFRPRFLVAPSLG